MRNRRGDGLNTVGIRRGRLRTPDTQGHNSNRYGRGASAKSWRARASFHGRTTEGHCAKPVMVTTTTEALKLRAGRNSEERHFCNDNAFFG